MYTSFVYGVTFFPPIPLPKGEFLTEETKTCSGWDEILQWSKDFVKNYNADKPPEHRVRVTAIIEKMAAFAAPKDFIPAMSPEQLARAQANNPELQKLSPESSSQPVGSGIPDGYISIKTPEGWQLVKAPKELSTDKPADQASLDALKKSATPPPPEGQPLRTEVPPEGLPQILNPKDVPLPFNSTLKIQSGNGIVPQNPTGPLGAGGGMSGPLGALANAPIATSADVEASNQIGAEKLGMRP
jgi:hypothetical protein